MNAVGFLKPTYENAAQYAAENLVKISVGEGFSLSMKQRIIKSVEEPHPEMFDIKLRNMKLLFSIHIFMMTFSLIILCYEYIDYKVATRWSEIRVRKVNDCEIEMIEIGKENDSTETDPIPSSSSTNQEKWKPIVVKGRMNRYNFDTSLLPRPKSSN